METLANLIEAVENTADQQPAVQPICVLSADDLALVAGGMGNVSFL